jgi:tetratricopeptide (TPR) repeat protein
MARYDRIARLEAPNRAETFPGWLLFRDLEGRERDTDLGRRARLRFLVLRPVLRMLERGPGRVDPVSLEQQIGDARRELSQLPARDAERLRLEGYLREIEGRALGRLALSTLALGETAVQAGLDFAGEEYFIAACSLARAHGYADAEALALYRLTHLYVRRGDLAAAESVAADAVAVAARTADERVGALAGAARCALELGRGQPEAALEAAWPAIERLGPADEERNRVLLDAGAAFRRLGLRDAADACYRIVMRWSARPGHRLEAHLGYALSAAEAGDEEAFEQRAVDPLEAAASAEPAMAAGVHLEIGRAALQLGQVDPARVRLRQALELARAGGRAELLGPAEELLASLEQRATLELTRATDPSPRAQTIARAIEVLGRALAASR